MSETGTALQESLVERIIEVIHADGLKPGSRIKESALARSLSVSRTPVRAALERLEKEGVVSHSPNRGMTLVNLPERRERAAQSSNEDDVLVAIARLRREGLLPEKFTESELMRQLQLDRPGVRNALTRLEDLGVTRRKTGYGWEFSDAIRDARAKAESYRFRILIECAAILEPDFRLEEAWVADMKERHRAIMGAEWQESSSVTLFEMNADFHLGICAASGNRYLKEAMHRQNQLRRLYNYNWRHGPERVQATCSQHLEIIDRLEAGENEVAAALMRQHLMSAATVRR